MTRKELRNREGMFSNNETPFTQLAARNLEILKAREAKRMASNKALKRLLVGLVIFTGLAVAGTYLFQSQQACEATNSSYCKD